MRSYNLVELPDRIVGVFNGSGVLSYFWLYWGTTFIDLLLSLLAAVIFYNTAKSMIATRKSLEGNFSQPINIYKSMILCMASAFFFRVFPDTIILLTWQEVSQATMDRWQVVNQFFDILAAIPFLIFFYLILRAGPVIEFQLLRRPIPTDLQPSWKMIRAPVISFVMVVLLSLMVVGTKLTP